MMMEGGRSRSQAATTTTKMAMTANNEKKVLAVDFASLQYSEQCI
jgi:hypothetical protein